MGKGKAGRRPVRPKSGSGVPLMPVVAGVILGMVLLEQGSVHGSREALLDLGQGSLTNRASHLA